MNECPICPACLRVKLHCNLSKYEVSDLEYCKQCSSSIVCEDCQYHLKEEDLELFIATHETSKYHIENIKTCASCKKIVDYGSVCRIFHCYSCRETVYEYDDDTGYCDDCAVKFDHLHQEMHNPIDIV